MAPERPSGRWQSALWKALTANIGSFANAGFLLAWPWSPAGGNQRRHSQRAASPETYLALAEQYVNAATSGRSNGHGRRIGCRTE
jgi:hypothetical protein